MLASFSLAPGDTYETLLQDHENPGSTLFILIDLVHISLGLYFCKFGGWDKLSSGLVEVQWSFLLSCKYSYLCVIIAVDLLSHLRHLELLGQSGSLFFWLALRYIYRIFSLAVDRQLFGFLLWMDLKKASGYKMGSVQALPSVMTTGINVIIIIYLLIKLELN